MGFSRYQECLLPLLQKESGDLFVTALPLGGHRLLVDSFVRLLRFTDTPLFVAIAPAWCNALIWKLLCKRLLYRSTLTCYWIFLKAAWLLLQSRPIIRGVWLLRPYLVLCIKRLLSNLSLFHFQPKDSDTHAYVHPWSSNDGDRNQENNQLLGLFLL